MKILRKFNLKSTEVEYLNEKGIWDFNKSKAKIFKDSYTLYEVLDDFELCREDFELETALQFEKLNEEEDSFNGFLSTKIYVKGDIYQATIDVINNAGMIIQTYIVVNDKLYEVSNIIYMIYNAIKNITGYSLNVNGYKFEGSLHTFELIEIKD